MRSQPLVGYAGVADTVHRYETRNRRTTISEQVLHSAEVTQPLFTHGADEQNVGLGPDVGGVHGTQDGQDRRQPPRVVTDTRSVEGVPPHTDRHVRPLGKYGVEMACDGHGPRRTAGPSPQGDDVSHIVDVGGVHAGLHKHVAKGCCARLFGEGGSGYFGEGHQSAHGFVVFGFDALECVLYRRVGENRLEFLGSIHGL